MAQIECKDLALAYEGVTVAEGLNFAVHAGDYLCIVGENGSGKSTLVRCLLGLKKAAGGDVVYGDGLTSRTIGYLPQQNDAQRDFPASVREIVLSGCIGRGGGLFYSASQKRAADAAMKKLGVDAFAGRCFCELSGGQQQRVRLCRALCAASKLLILDEPTTGLDPLAGAEFYALIEKLNREDGMTIIMVSHDTGAPLRHATHVLHLKHKMLFFGTCRDYVASPVGRQFLGGCADV